MNISTSLQPECITSPFDLFDNLIFVKAKLNGFEGNFLFDSGSADIVLNKKNIGKKNLIETETEIRGINGIDNVNQTLLKNFNWNGLIIKNKMVVAIDLQHMEKGLNQKIDGIIGYNQIRDYALRVDYKAKKISMWKNFNKSPYKIVNRFKFVMDKHIPIFSINIGGKQFKMGLDTGAEINLLHSSNQKKINKNLKFLREYSLDGITDLTQNLKLYEVDELKTDKAAYKKLPFVFSNIDHLKKVMNGIDGLLGYQFLKHRQIAIHFPACEILFLRKKPNFALAN